MPNEASYTDQGEKVIDDSTCLEWQKAALEDSVDWPAALEYCAELTLSGSSDWRLPTRIELSSIARLDEIPGFDPTAFAATSTPAFWSASAAVYSITGGDAPGAGAAWVQFIEAIGTEVQSFKRNVRCVRGGGAGEEPLELAVAPANQYSEPASGEVRDNYTGLIWQQAQSDTTMPHADADAYCASLALGGNTWRLPSARELLTLVNEGRQSPSINLDVFPDTEWLEFVRYWARASTPDTTSPNRLGITFAEGRMSYADARDELGWAKCVR